MERDRQFIFRKTETNHFTLPVLLSLLERNTADILLHPEIIDMPLSLTLSKRNDRPAVIAYSFMTHEIQPVWEEIKRLRELHQDRVLLLAGGPHPTGDPQSVLKMGFDAVCVGEGETTLPEFFRLLLQKGDGIRGSIIRSDQQACLDESFPISDILSIIPPLEITRGCRNHCRFCQTAARPPVHRSLESVRYYLDELVRRGYHHRVGFISPSGFEYGSEKPGQLHPEKIEAILAMAAERKIRHIEYGLFPSEVRPNTVRPDLLELVRKYCSNQKITVGAQSGSLHLLKKLKRGHTCEHIREAAAVIHEHGLTPVLDFIVGFPGETREDRMLTLDLMKTLNAKYGARNQVHYFLPLAGTDLAEQKPAPLDSQSMELLEQFTRGGIATNWWKQGMALAASIVKVGKELSG